MIIDNCQIVIRECPEMPGVFQVYLFGTPLTIWLRQFHNGWREVQPIGIWPSWAWSDLIVEAAHRAILNRIGVQQRVHEDHKHYKERTNAKP